MMISINRGRAGKLFVTALVAATGAILTSAKESEARNFYTNSGKRAYDAAVKEFGTRAVKTIDRPHAPRGRGAVNGSDTTADVPSARKGRGPGRPKGSKNKVKRGPGRPPGSKNKTGRRGRPKGFKVKMSKPGYSINGKKLGRPPKAKVEAKATGKRRGRPPGSKNKKKGRKVKAVAKAKTGRKAKADKPAAAPTTSTGTPAATDNGQKPTE